MILLRKKLLARFFVLGMALLLHQSIAYCQEHPQLNLTKEGVEKIRAELGKVPLFDSSLSDIKEEVDAEIASGIQVPIPKDFSGGFTHERHKKNFL
ncbi:MAG: heparinase, partial [Flavobacteriales bacterium]